MERLILRLETIGVEVLGKVNELFRKKVQLEEQIKENEADLHLHRGKIAAIEKAQEEAKAIFQGGELDRYLMRLLVIGNEALMKLNELFRVKVQKEEELASVMVQLHFHRGSLAALDRAQKEAKEIRRGEQIEELFEKKPLEVK